MVGKGSGGRRAPTDAAARSALLLGALGGARSPAGGERGAAARRTAPPGCWAARPMAGWRGQRWQRRPCPPVVPTQLPEPPHTVFISPFQSNFPTPWSLLDSLSLKKERKKKLFPVPDLLIFIFLFK